MTMKDLDRIAYEAYTASVDRVSVHGEPLPSWDELLAEKPDVAQAWNCAAVAVRTATLHEFADYMEGTGFVAAIKPSSVAEIAREIANE